MSFFSLFLAWQDSFEIGDNYSNPYYHIYGVGAPVQDSTLLDFCLYQVLIGSTVQCLKHLLNK